MDRRGSLRFTLGMVLGSALVTVAAQATQFTFTEVPGAACQPFNDEEDWQRAQDGMINNSSNDMITFCPVPAVKDSTLLFPAPTFIADAQVFFSDRNNRSRDFWCLPELETMSGSLFRGDQKFAPDGRIDRKDVFWVRPFGTVDISGQMINLDIQCAVSGSTSNGKSRIHAYKMTLEYPNH